MFDLKSEFWLIILCGVVVVSYLFSLLSRYIRIPSVLLLMGAGMGLKWVASAYGFEFVPPAKLIEILGTVGLIMIVLEAGLDLRLTRDKIPLIRNAFFSALVILILSAIAITFILYYFLHEPVVNCIVYALPLSIISSAIVLPSLHGLSSTKREFLVYEASLSDIIGIVLFNYFTASEILTGTSILIFGGNILASVFLSVLISLVLLLIMTRSRLNIRFFLVFSLLILMYATGKILHLPSLIIILFFGLLINNWDKIPVKKLTHAFPIVKVEELRHLLHSMTAETAFLIRTFFFLLFGFSINLQSIVDPDVILVGSWILGALVLTRFFYLRFNLHTDVFPEVFFLPRGLITIVLFYKIPESMRLSSFNEGILFFLILTTGIIMSLGLIFYRKKDEHAIVDHTFQHNEPSESI